MPSLPCLAALLPLLAPPLVSHTPPLSDEVLFNPHMGLYLQYPPTDARPDEWFMQICDIAYYRLDWNDVNPEAGVYRFDDYFGPLFDFWVKQQHKRVAFRVMCQSMHSRGEYVTPKWVFDQGVPGVKHRALNGKEQTDPVFWDARYLNVQAEFIAKLGQYLDGREGLEFVDIGSIGEWGEMHLARWTPAQLEETGFSETGYALAYRRMIDAYRAAFPRTPVFLNIGGQDHLGIDDYAAIRGLHFRQDGLNPAGASYDCGTWLYPPYSRRGVLCNFEFHSGWSEMLEKQWDVAKTIAKGLEAPISYLNTNLFGGGGYRQAPEEARKLLAGAGRRVGYRFVITRVDQPAEATVSADRTSRLRLASLWRNDGVAPCYDSFALEWSLRDAGGQPVAVERLFPRVPTTQWWQGEVQSVAGMLRLPAGTPPGEYRLAVKVVLPETGQAIRLGISGRTADGAYVLGPVRLVKGEAPQGVVFEEGFEGQPAPWGAPQGIAAAVDDQAAHTGQRSLRVEGAVAAAWNYATCRVPAPLVPGAQYRLSGWMRVDKLDPARKAPFLKLGINAADGKWLTNAGSNLYDTDQPGTWQRLEALVEVPLDGALGDIAIEKGDNTTPVSLALRLDDLRLELTEGG